MRLFLHVLIFIAATSIVVYLYLQDFYRSPTPPERPLIIAHRGASGIAPENTLSSVKEALRAEADIIEIDVHLTRDNEVLVIHDDRVDRTTNGKGFVRDMILPDLKALDAGSWFDPTYEGEALPTLGEVLDRINGRCQLLIEIKKHDRGYYDGLVRAILDQIYERKAESWCILQSFHSPIIEEIQLLDPDFTIHKLLHIDLPILPAYEDGEWHFNNIFDFPGVEALNPAHEFMYPRFVNKAHREGYKVFVYTVNEPATMKKLTQLGVDGIITDFPLQAMEVQRGKSP